MRTGRRIVDKSAYLCIDCKVNTRRTDYYSVHDRVWLQATGGSKRGMLCLDCLERRLGRRLTAEDFRPCIATQECLKAQIRIRGEADGALPPAVCSR